MKATGIVRRIDELGRVVIPKEIRRTLHFREGDPLEIYTDQDGGVILKKYSVIGEMEPYVREFADSIYHTIGCTAVITDKDTVLAASGQGKKDLLGQPLSAQLQKSMDQRKGVKKEKSGREVPIPLTENDKNEYASQCIMPIIGGGDVLGAVILTSQNETLTDAAYKNAETAAYFLGNQSQ
ncbi:MAG: AbrB/MazE/SpoVT family DNA-binding domain-containing protein [Clostridia bacterium]|nr:AbrB/MazE/SpoVT family DNA-binding domain-containing protein [Clostridia bacterium]